MENNLTSDTNAMKKVFLICPVRNATGEQIARIKCYKKELKASGVELFYPADDNPLEHTDNIGYEICRANADAIKAADEIHIFWDKTSSGSLFDLGVAFGLGKRLFIVNIEEVERTQMKSFANMILSWSGQ